MIHRLDHATAQVGDVGAGDASSLVGDDLHCGLPHGTHEVVAYNAVSDVGDGQSVRALRFYGAATCLSHERLCVGPSWPQVQRVLKDADTENGTDIRDRAILLLLATYGLRASEAGHLKLGDIDWEREQLLVTRSKTRKRAVFPLSTPVAAAIRKYIDHVRPTCRHDGLFVRRQAPFSVLKPVSFSSLVARRLQESGIKLQGSGAHSLRHACAARLLAEGLSLKAIGDQLGHVSADATRIYAKGTSSP